MINLTRNRAEDNRKKTKASNSPFDFKFLSHQKESHNASKTAPQSCITDNTLTDINGGLNTSTVSKYNLKSEEYIVVPSFIHKHLKENRLSWTEACVLIGIFVSQVKGFTRIESIIRRWYKTPNDGYVKEWRDVNSCLRDAVNSLETKGYISILKDNRKFLGVTIYTHIENGTDLQRLIRVELSKAKTVCISKTITRDLTLSLDSLLVAYTFSLLKTAKCVFANQASVLLGITRKTFSKYAKSLYQKEYLTELKISKKLPKGIVWKTVFALKLKYKINSFNNKTYEEYCSLVSCRNIYPSPSETRVTNNQYSFGVEFSKQQKNLNMAKITFLSAKELISDTEVLKTIVQELSKHNYASRLTDDEIKNRVEKFLSKTKSKFKNDHHLLRYCLKASPAILINKPYFRGLRTKRFIEKVQLELPQYLSKHTIKQVIDNILSEGFRFNDEEHAFKFTKSRIRFQNLQEEENTSDKGFMKALKSRVSSEYFESDAVSSKDLIEGILSLIIGGKNGKRS